MRRYGRRGAGLMRCSTRGDYGLRALIELADHYGQGPLQCSEIALRATSRAVPRPAPHDPAQGRLRALPARPAGGHELARDPAEIPVYEAIVALEGSLSPVAWLDEPADRTDHPHQCGQREIWERIRESTSAILASYTIADLHAKEPRAVGGQVSDMSERVGAAEAVERPRITEREGAAEAVERPRITEREGAAEAVERGNP